MGITLPALPYSMDALQPHISKETLEYHYGKHHQSYVNNLAGLIKSTEFAMMPLEEIIQKSTAGIYNNAAQIFNHTFYWNSLSPTGGGSPSGKMEQAITQFFGGFDNFKEEFTNKAKTLFGSGWVFLCQQKDGSLIITQEANAACPLTTDLTPLLTCDVWEHAYYIDYRNARPQYLEAFWSLVNWNFAEDNLA